MKEPICRPRHAKRGTCSPINWSIPKGRSRRWPQTFAPMRQHGACRPFLMRPLAPGRSPPARWSRHCLTSPASDRGGICQPGLTPKPHSFGGRERPGASRRWATGICADRSILGRWRRSVRAGMECRVKTGCGGSCGTKQAEADGDRLGQPHGPHGLCPDKEQDGRSGDGAA